MGFDIHNYAEKIERTERQIKGLKTPEKNKELILKYEQHLIRQNLSKARVLKYLEILGLISRKINKDFTKTTKEDIEAFVTEIQRKDYSEYTKQTYKVILRRFFQWFKGTEEFPPEVKWISIHFPKNKKKLPSEGDLLIEAEIKKIIQNTTNSRDKAIVSTLWESGTRIGELMSMRIKDLVFDKYGTLITVSGKTGSRKLRLVTSTPYLANWLQNHPSQNDRESPLWVNIGNKNRGKLLRYVEVKRILFLVCRKAGINKRCNPHSFRHARATFLANHLTEFQMNQYLGWIQGSDMPSTYVHLSGKNTEEALLKLNGIIVEEKKTDSLMKPRTCSRCDTINAEENNFCRKCGGILDIIAAAKIEEEERHVSEKRKLADDYLNKLMKDPDILKLVATKLKEVRIEEVSPELLTSL